MTLTRSLGVCVCLALLAACEPRQPLGSDAPHDPARRTNTYGAPTLLANFQYQALCNTQQFLQDTWCLDQPAKVIAALPPVRHRVTVRITGVIQLYGVFGGPAAHCPRVYPLGTVLPNRPPFLRTGVYWSAPRNQAVHVPLVPVGGDSATVEGSVDIPEGGELYIYRLYGGSLRSCHMVSPPPVVTVTVQEIRTAPILRIVCGSGGAVTRGDSITCKAEVDPASLQDSLRVSEWSFDGLSRTDGDVTAHTWSGVLVDSGTVRVKGKVNGQEVSDSALIAVNSRVWPKLQAASPAHDSLAGDGLHDLPAVPVADTSKPFGYNSGDFADSHIMRDSTALPYAGRARRVDSGPNAGWWYVASPLSSPYWLVHHSDAWKPSHPWFKKQHGGSPGKTGWLPYCPKYEITLLRRRALYHEGLLSAPISPTDLYQPAYTHYTFFQDWLRNHDVNKLFERQRWNPRDNPFGYNSFGEMLELVWVTEVQDPQTTANKALVDGSYPVPITCRAR